MPTEDELRATLIRYTEAFSAGDADAWVGLFTEDATVEDPVGSPKHVGRDAIRAFFEAGHAMADKITLTIKEGPVVCGSEGSFAMEVMSEMGGATIVLTAIDVMTFDDAGAITSQRAFWSPSGIRTL